MLHIPSDVLYLLKTLQDAEFEASIVGGAVRDLLIAQSDPDHQLPTDYDLATNAKPEEVQTLFPESFYENEFGTVAISANHVWEQFQLEEPESLPVKKVSERENRLIDLSQASKLHASLEPTNSEIKPKKIALPNYEITTYRSKEIYDSNYRKPDSLEWGETLSQDLTRRDFTINALALRIKNEWLTEKLSTKPAAYQLFDVPESAYTLIDEHEGLYHLAEFKLETVGDAKTRFEEDALRMLRAIRFAVQLNYEISEEIFEAITQHHQLLQHVSWERIRDEFLKMLASPYPREAIELLDETKLLDHILPEIQAGKGVEQGGHHTTDVWTHSLDALEECPSPDPIVRLATLLHDVAKPQTQAFQNETITFYNHEVKGAHLSKEIGRRLRLSKHEIDKIFILVRYHMFYYQPHNTDASIRRFMRKVGLEHIDDILDVREADRLGSGARRTSWRLEEMKERMIEQLNQPMDVTDLAINGHDLMEELGVKPGPELGTILAALLELVLENPELNTKDLLLEEAKKLKR